MVQHNVIDTLLLPTDARSFATYWAVMDQWVMGHWHFIVFALLLAAALFAALTLLDKLAEKWVARNENDPRYIAILIRIAARTSTFFRLMVALEIVDDLASAPGRVSELIHVLFSIAIVVQMALWVRELFVASIERMTHIGKAGSETLETAIVLIRILSSIVIYTIAGIMILDQLGLNITGLLAGLGIGGIAIGLAAKNVFEELFSALSIIFDEPFKRGDKIRFDSTTAKVERVGIKSTRLRSASGEQLIISNTILLNKEIANLNRTGERKAEFLLNLSKLTPPDKIRGMAEPIGGIVNAQGYEFVWAGVKTLGMNSIDYEISYEVSAAQSKRNAQATNDMLLEVLDYLKKAGIKLASPTNMAA
jgi:small-conductance mechanosensitive channel